MAAYLVGFLSILDTTIIGNRSCTDIGTNLTRWDTLWNSSAAKNFTVQTPMSWMWQHHTNTQVTPTFSVVRLMTTTALAVHFGMTQALTQPIPWKAR